MERTVRPEENLADGAMISPGEPRVARRMSMQIAEPLNARFFLAQIVKEVGLELVVPGAAAGFMLRFRAGFCNVRNLESFTANEPEERDRKLQLFVDI